MKSFAVAALFASLLTQSQALGSAGCGSSIASGLTQGGLGLSNNLRITLKDGTVRTYILHIPSSYNINTPAPLILSFHGRGESGSAQEGRSQLSREDWNPNMIVAYPDGIANQWQGDPAAVGYDDIGFVNQLIDSLEASFCIDPNRIYSSGFSNGGGLSMNILACDPALSQRIAAFSACSGAYYQSQLDSPTCDGTTVPMSCSAGRSNIPFFETHGDSDGVIAYNGGGHRGYCMPSIHNFFNYKSSSQGLTTSTNMTTLSNLGVTSYSYGQDSGAAGLVTHLKVAGMDHTWPSQNGGQTFDATPLIMKFFNTYTLNGSTANSTTTSGTTSSSSSTSIIQSSAGASSSVLVSSSSSSSTSSSTIKTTSTTTTAAAAPTTTVTCPAGNGTIYTAASGATFLIECGIDHQAGDMGSTSVSSFAQCIEACANTAGCVDVSLSGAACYMKKSLGLAIANSGIKGAKLVTGVSAAATTSSSAAASTSTTVSTSTTTSTIASTSSTTSTVPATTAAPIVQVATTATTSSASLPSGYFVSYIPVTLGTMSTTLSLTLPGCASTISTNTLATNTATMTTIVTSTSTSTTATATATKVATAGSYVVSSITSLTCPTNNGTTYTDSTGGSWTIMCGYDTTPNIMAAPAYNTFDQCISLCASTPGCVNVAYTGACYLKASVGNYINRGSNDYRSAVKLS
ncbi:carbohydrate esterase family 1 protein [Myriangium duriaei CBS 260.36]|uniref:feruloyl esterase n=1 Tax=Myriangium duriaei CBS 260.36 TaxID=1168546 RepID=A0A9P4J2W9_9PEZI|nr:carbohydrate esterase family 1 protein [Myriangium duriaei CBS 260.36]